jgi:hypothetical protein
VVREELKERYEQETQRLNMNVQRCHRRRRRLRDDYYDSNEDRHALGKINAANDLSKAFAEV